MILVFAQHLHQHLYQNSRNANLCFPAYYVTLDQFIQFHFKLFESFYLLYLLIYSKYHSIELNSCLYCGICFSETYCLENVQFISCSTISRLVFSLSSIMYYFCLIQVLKMYFFESPSFQAGFQFLILLCSWTRLRLDFAKSVLNRSFSPPMSPLS